MSEHEFAGGVLGAEEQKNDLPLHPGRTAALILRNVNEIRDFSRHAGGGGEDALHLRAHEETAKAGRQSGRAFALHLFRVDDLRTRDRGRIQGQVGKVRAPGIRLGRHRLRSAFVDRQRHQNCGK